MRRKVFAFSVLMLMLCIFIGCNVSKAEDVHHTLTFHSGADGIFSNDDTENVITYAEPVREEITKYSHTPNVNDAGEALTGCRRRTEVLDVVTIPGAASLHVTIKYQTFGATQSPENYVCMWSGAHPDYKTSINYNSSMSGQLGAGEGTREYTVSGDSVTFGFLAGGSLWYVDENGCVGYGYYATVTGIGVNQTVISGNYEDPAALDSLKNFNGWSLNADGSGTISDKEVSLLEEDTDLYARYATAPHGTYRNVDWVVKENGRLVIGKEGEIQTFADVSSQSTGWPWTSIGIQTAEFAGTVNGTGPMTGMFSSCTRLTSVDFTNFNTSNVTSMDYFFNYCVKLETANIALLDTSNVTNMSRMFALCNKVHDLDFSSWDTHSLTNMDEMFLEVRYDGTLDLTALDVSHVASMKSIFSQMMVDTLDLTGWDVSKVTKGYETFRQFSGHLVAPDLHWDSMTSQQYMLYGSEPCSVFDIPRWSFGQLVDGYYLFANGYAAINAQDWNLDGMTSMANMFRILKGGPIDISGWHSTTAYKTDYMFNYSDATLKEINVSNWNMPALTSINEMFGWCQGLERIIGLETWDASRISQMENLFNSCYELQNVDLSTWKCNNLSTCRYMFYNCDAMTRIDLRGFNTQYVTDISNMFGYCDNLEYLDISGFNNSRVTSMGGIFTGDTKLSTVVLGGNSPWYTTYYVSHGTSTELPVPPVEQDGVAYSGRWIREDGVYGPYTPTELRTSYTGAMLGTWVWEKAMGTGYTIVFEAPEGSLGAMPIVHTPSCSQYYYLPSNKFRRPGANFSYWRDIANGYSYSDGYYINPNRYSEGQVVVLTAVFDSEGGGAIEMQDGAFTFSMKKNNTAIFTGLPAETKYQIFEDTPVGWVLIADSNTSGTIKAEQRSDANFMNQAISNDCSLILSGDKFIDQMRAGQDEFQFELLDEDGNVVSTTTTGAGGNIVFGALTFTADDVGRDIYYTVREVVPGEDKILYGTTDENVTFDTHEERIRVVVSYKVGAGGTVISSTDNFDAQGNRVVATMPADESWVAYYHSSNMDDNEVRDMETLRADGTPVGDYESGKPYASVFRVPGATKIHLKVDFSYPRGANGVFAIWSGAHTEVGSGTWSSECNLNNAYRKYTSGNSSAVSTVEFDIPGDSFSAYYLSNAIPVGGYGYNEYANFGYHITATVVEMAKTNGVRADGSLISDCTSNKVFSDVITVPGAESLHVELSYGTPRGYFYIWQGEHAEVYSGASGFNSDFNTGSAIKSYLYSSANENVIVTDSFDVDGNSLSLMYYSYSLPRVASNYGENSNYGYCMKIMPVMGSDGAGYVVHSSTPNIDSAGVQHGNYTAGKDYVDVVRIPGAHSLQFTIVFRMGSNDRLALYPGSHPEYNGSTSTSSARGYMTSYTDEERTYTYTVPGDTATFVFHTETSSTGGGYGYYATVRSTNPLAELIAEAIYDDDGDVFYNTSGAGYLVLNKRSDINMASDKTFTFEIAFVDDKGVAYDPQCDIEYHMDETVLPENMLTIYHVGVYHDGNEQVLYTERYPRLQSGDAFSIKSKQLDGYVYRQNDYTNDNRDDIACTMGDTTTAVHLYYDELPHKLTVRHMLIDYRDVVIETKETEILDVYASEDIVLMPKQYDGYVYVSNSYDLIADSNLHGKAMPDGDLSITLKYKVGNALTISHVNTLGTRRYRVTLPDTFTGLTTARYGDFDFVDGVAEVEVTDGDDGSKRMVSPYDTTVLVESLTDVMPYARIRYSDRAYSSDGIYTNQTSISYRLYSPQTYRIEVSATPRHKLIVQYCRVDANHNEMLKGSYTYYLFENDLIDLTWPEDSSHDFGSGYGSYYNYYIGNNVEPGTRMPNEDYNAIVYYGAIRYVTIRHILVAEDGTETLSGTNTLWRGSWGRFTVPLRTFEGYVFDNAICTTDSEIVLTSEEPIVGTLKGADITVEVRYRAVQE